jgi:xanthosine utilization system XapX-like protein
MAFVPILGMIVGLAAIVAALRLLAKREWQAVSWLPVALLGMAAAGMAFWTLSLKK